MITFDQAFDRLIGHEGGFTNDPRDNGNWTGGRPNVGELKGTKFGIAANTYPDIDIERLTVDAAKAIYYRDWWLKVGADQLDGAIIFQLWVFAVNAGMGTAKRLLQRAAAVPEDGQIGPRTVAALRAMSASDVVLKFNSNALRFYASLSTWPTFGKGWALRVAGQLDYGATDT